jgi:SWI/SNF related-matrix-associated actin-dependent regulator of chromatin subfamily C
MINKADNPVLTLTSFLAQLVSPKVAQAAAEAAVQKLKESKNLNQTSPVKQVPTSPTKQVPTSPTKQAPTSPKKNGGVEKAVATAFGSAAAKAYTLATHEELEMQKATRALIETQLKKMELKLQHFQEMEAVLEMERKELEHERHQLYLDRLELKHGSAPEESHVNAVDVDGDVQMEGQIFALQ